MGKKRTLPKDDFSEEAVKKRRTLPKGDIALICILVAIQIITVMLVVLYTPTPKDVIDQYTITVEPKSNGTLDITYEVVWTALDGNEPLTWVEIGMPNPSYRPYEGSLSDTVLYAEEHNDENYCSYVLHFPREYIGGETVRFSFKVNQQGMLTQKPDGTYFYEFVPGWFNEIPVENYTFRWKLSEGLTTHNAPITDDGYAVWWGSFEPGGYTAMQVSYDETTFFPGAPTVVYVPFEDDGAYNALKENKAIAIGFGVIVIIGIMIWQVYVIDCFVSYHRGRGFLSGYGHRIHTYGRVNPRYRRAANAHAASSSGRGYSGGGRGCACACACACAGGGRAGCSQKDTSEIRASHE